MKKAFLVSLVIATITAMTAEGKPTVHLRVITPTHKSPARHPIPAPAPQARAYLPATPPPRIVSGLPGVKSPRVGEINGTTIHRGP